MTVGYKTFFGHGNVSLPFDLDAECTEIHDLNKSQQCLFVTTVEDCVEIIEYLDYNYYVFCKFGHERAILAVVLCIIWLAMLFIALGVTSNCFLCPSLFAISRHLHLSQNVAGVTLLAFGNGSPDIFSSIAGLQKASAELAIASLIGAGVFVTSVVAGSVFLTQNFSLMVRPFLRDVFFYICAASWAFALFFVGPSYVFHGIGLVALYFVYILVVLSSRYIYLKKQRHKSDEKAVEAQEGVIKFKGQKQKKLKDDQDSTGIVLKAFYFTDFEWYEEPTNFSDTCKIYYIENDSIKGSANNLGSTLSIQSKNNNTISTDKMHLCSKYKKDRGELWEFLCKLCPINLRKWHNYSRFEKMVSLIKSPAVLIMKITVPVPVVDASAGSQEWCRALCSIQCITGPFFISLVSEYAFERVGDMLPIGVIVVIISSVFAVLVFCTSERSKPPAYHWIFAYLGFAVSVSWIYCLANEIVALLQVFGVFFNLSDAILGLTVLAWGNSLSDFLSNVAVARKQYPRMGISACFGGPLLGLLLGLGTPCILEVAKGRAPAEFALIFSGQFIILFATLAISLLTTTTIMVLFKFKTRKLYGVFLIALYIFFMTLSILEECGVFDFDP